MKVIPVEQNPKVLDMIEEQKQKPLKNIDRNVVAKFKQLERMLGEEGLELEIPDEYKWHHSHKGCEDFVGKLNLANLGLLHESLKNLRLPDKKFLQEEEKKKEEMKRLGQLQMNPSYDKITIGQIGGSPMQSPVNFLKPPQDERDGSNAEETASLRQFLMSKRRQDSQDTARTHKDHP